MFSSMILTILQQERSPNTCHQAWQGFAPSKQPHDIYQAILSNMGMERGRMRKEPDNNQSWTGGEEFTDCYKVCLESLPIL